MARLDSGQPRPAYFLNIGSFYYGIHQNIYFVRVTYDSTVSYIFPHFENGLSALSILAESANRADFEEVLANAGRLLSYEEAIEDGEIRRVI